MGRLRLCAFADEASENVLEQIKALNENGIDLIEVRGVDGKNVSTLTLDEARQAKKTYSEGGIGIWSIGSPIGKVDIKDDFAKELDKFKHTLDIAHVMEAECIRMFSFYGTGGDIAYRDEVMERLGKYAEAARGSGVTLCHENERGIYGDTAERCLDIAVSVPEIKAVFDPANYMLCNVEVPKAWSMLREYVYYNHIKDATVDHKIVPAGYGDSHMGEYLKDFADNGGGVLTLEPHLMEFVGLDALANNEDVKNMGKFNFSSNREAFDFAVSSLRALIKDF